jgi:hypothetical protein
LPNRVKEDIKEIITKTKQDISIIEKQIEDSQQIDEDLKSFMKFGLSYTDKLADDWWVLSHNERVQCQLLLFPGGITFNSQK